MAGATEILEVSHAGDLSLEIKAVIAAKNSGAVAKAAATAAAKAANESAARELLIAQEAAKTTCEKSAYNASVELEIVAGSNRSCPSPGMEQSGHVSIDILDETDHGTEGEDETGHGTQGIAQYVTPLRLASCDCGLSVISFLFDILVPIVVGSLSSHGRVAFYICGFVLNVLMAPTPLYLCFLEARYEGVKLVRRGRIAWFYLRDQAYIPLSPLLECLATLFCAFTFAASAFKIAHLNQTLLTLFSGASYLLAVAKLRRVIRLHLQQHSIIML